jgi:hypothetical protein
MQRYDARRQSHKDGLNLVAKEGPAVNQRDGLLCLLRGRRLGSPRRRDRDAPVRPEAAAAALDTARDAVDERR